MRVPVGANLGHITVVPCINVWLEAAIAATTLGPLREEAVLFPGHHNLDLPRGCADMEADGLIMVRRSGRAGRSRGFRPESG